MAIKDQEHEQRAWDWITAENLSFLTICQEEHYIKSNKCGYPMISI